MHMGVRCAARTRACGAGPTTREAHTATASHATRVPSRAHPIGCGVARGETAPGALARRRQPCGSRHRLLPGVRSSTNARVRPSTRMAAVTSIAATTMSATPRMSGGSARLSTPATAGNRDDPAKSVTHTWPSRRSRPTASPMAGAPLRRRTRVSPGQPTHSSEAGCARLRGDTARLSRSSVAPPSVSSSAG